MKPTLSLSAATAEMDSAEISAMLAAAVSNFFIKLLLIYYDDLLLKCYSNIDLKPGLTIRYKTLP